jgi:hypothetical protein
MSNTVLPPAFHAVFRNEMEKIWARRGKALLAALIVLIAGAGLFSLHTYQETQNNMQSMRQSVVQMRQQVDKTRRALQAAPAGKRAALRQQITQENLTIQQMEESSNTSVNERSQVRQLTPELSTLPVTQQGITMEQLALARYRISHGQSYYNPASDGGWRLVGLIFAGPAIMLFALLAVLIVSDTVSSELQSGTWGILLLHAPRRMQVYIGKWSAAVVTIWMFMAVTAHGIFAFGSALMGMGSSLAPHVLNPRLVSMQTGGGFLTVVPSAQVFHLIPQWSYDLLALGLAMLTLAGLATLLIALSVITRSTFWSLIIGVLVVLSSLFSVGLGHWAVLDPTLSLPLISEWTGAMAMQDNMLTLNVQMGMLVTVFWALAAMIAGLWRVKYTDV